MINLMQNSTIHGLNHISSASSKFFKFIWILLVLFGIGGILTNMVFIILKFKSNPVGISQTVNYKNFTWPDLTFCNPSSPYDLERNQTYVQYWKQLTKQSEDVMKMMIRGRDVMEYYFNYKVGQKSLIMSTADPGSLDVNNYLNFVNSLYFGYSYTDKFLDKHQMAEDVYLSEDRTKIFSADLVEFHQNIPCHTFHFEKSKTVNNFPVGYLSMTITHNQDSYQFYNESFPYKTLLAYVSNDEHMVNGGNKIILRKNYKNVVTISQIHTKRNGVRSPCRDEKFVVELYDALLSSTKLFEGNYKHCLQVARQKTFVKKCNCYSPFLPIYKNESGLPHICFNMTMYSIYELLKNFYCIFPPGLPSYEDYDKLEKQLTKECGRFEAPKCEESIYKFEVEKEGLTREQETKGKISPDGRYFKVDAIKVIFKKESQFVDLFEEELQYRFSQFLSDIGGLMGLWLGLSVIGLFEIIEFLYNYMKTVCVRHDKYEPPSNVEMVS